MLRKLQAKTPSWRYDYGLFLRTPSVRLGYNIGGRKYSVKISPPLATYLSLSIVENIVLLSDSSFEQKELLAQNLLENFFPERKVFVFCRFF